jgi:hypothetical protein
VRQRWQRRRQSRAGSGTAARVRQGSCAEPRARAAIDAAAAAVAVAATIAGTVAGTIAGAVAGAVAVDAPVGGAGKSPIRRRDKRDPDLRVGNVSQKKKKKKERKKENIELI